MEAQIKTQNYWKGRQGFSIKALVLHITEGSLFSTAEHFRNPKSQVSAHKILDELGVWYKCVDEKDTAWHCGRVVRPTWKGLINKWNLGGKVIAGGLDKFAEEVNKNYDLGILVGEMGEVYQSALGGVEQIVNPNLYTIGVEAVVRKRSIWIVPRWKQWISWARGIKDICDRHGITEIVDHNKIRADKLCPGRYFNARWAKILIKYFV